MLSLEKEMATHSSVLAWRIPGTGEPGGLPSMGSGGAICLVNSDNERDSGMLTSYATPERSASPNFLEGQVAFTGKRYPTGWRAVGSRQSVHQEGREPLPEKAGESTLLSRSGGEKGLR